MKIQVDRVMGTTEECMVAWCLIVSDRHTSTQRPLFHDNLVKPAPKRLSQSGLYWNKR